MSKKNKKEENLERKENSTKKTSELLGESESVEFSLESKEPKSKTIKVSKKTTSKKSSSKKPVEDISEKNNIEPVAEKKSAKTPKSKSNTGTSISEKEIVEKKNKDNSKIDASSGSSTKKTSELLGESESVEFSLESKEPKSKTIKVSKKTTSKKSSSKKLVEDISEENNIEPVVEKKSAKTPKSKSNTGTSISEKEIVEKKNKDSAKVEANTSMSNTPQDNGVLDTTLLEKTGDPEKIKETAKNPETLSVQKNQNKKKHVRNERRKKSLLKKTTTSELTYNHNYNYNRVYSSDDSFNLQPPVSPPQKPIPFVDLSKVATIQKQQKTQNFPKNEVVPINPEKLLTSVERKDPFFQNFFRDVEKFVVKEMLIERGAKVLIGVSGGVDSVVLLDVLAILADKYNFSLYVAHYNHNLRGKASNEDENFVKKLSASYNLPYYWASGKVQQYSEKNNLSIEEAARLLRYLFFERTARTINIDFLATAHTADDSAETFLLNLFRGAGLTGLSGIPSRRQFIKDVILFRPFIGIKKKKIIEYAEKRGLKWREDDTNLLDKYTRNKVRIDLLPKLQKEYNPSIVDVINRASKLIHSADKIIHDYVRTHIHTLLADISTDRVCIKLPLFRTFDEFIRGEMLQMVLMKYFKMQAISMNTVDRVLRLENSEIGAMCEISKTIFSIRDRQLLIIAKKTIPVKINQKIEKTGKFTIGNLVFVLKEISLDEIEYNKNPNVEYFDFNLVPNILTIRNWESGDEFSPIGMKGKMKVSDFLSNEKVAVLDKPNVLVLSISSGDVLWVCQKRINDKFKITDKTKRVLKIEIKNIL